MKKLEPARASLYSRALHLKLCILFAHATSKVTKRYSVQSRVCRRLRYARAATRRFNNFYGSEGLFVRADYAPGRGPEGTGNCSSCYDSGRAGGGGSLAQIQCNARGDSEETCGGVHKSVLGPGRLGGAAGALGMSDDSGGRLPVRVLFRRTLAFGLCSLPSSFPTTCQRDSA